eukprot:749427-Ditylum_brightwellii.AAC.1
MGNCHGTPHATNGRERQDRPKLGAARQKAKGSLNIYSTASISTNNMIRDLPGFGTVWLYEEGVANILSLSKVAERFRVT